MIISKTWIFKSSVLVWTHTLLDNSLRVFLLTYLSSLECKLIRVGWAIHFWLLNETHFAWL